MTLILCIFFLFIISETISFSFQRSWAIAKSVPQCHSIKFPPAHIHNRKLNIHHFQSTSVLPLLSHRTIHNNVIDPILKLRGGQLANDWMPKSVKTVKESILSSPKTLFNTVFAALLVQAIAFKLINLAKCGTKSHSEELTNTKDFKPVSVQRLQLRYLIAFWLLRMADWLQGPYFFEVFSSKILSNGQQPSLDLISRLFLVGFGTTAICGPFIGRLIDKFGGRVGTILYTLFYSLSSLSTQSNQLPILVLGRVAGGLGTSLLFSAPEAWIVKQHQKLSNDDGMAWLGDTFGMAYGGDAIVAIIAGQLATWVASRIGPTGPFLLSTAVLATALLILIIAWKDQSKKALISHVHSVAQLEPSLGDALKLIRNDRRIWLLGATQALFEGAMYIFVLQWPPMIKRAIEQYFASTSVIVPYGTIFSCFMTCCLLGTSLFGRIRNKKSCATQDCSGDSVGIEKSYIRMLTAANLAIAIATYSSSSHHLWLLIFSFLAFEVCVGMYFPLIGMLRSTYFPSSHRSIIQNLFGIPLNLIVVSVFLSINKLGNRGALWCANVALSFATLCMSFFHM